jgi:hypothetical protein
LGALLLAEGGAQLAFLARFGHFYRYARLRGICELLEGNTPALSERFLPHPYVGYVHRPGERARTKSAALGWRYPHSPVLKRGPGLLNVLILGGSVAQQAQRFLAQELQQALRRRDVTGVKVALAAGALDGFHQPQQVTAAAYFLSLGAEYDVIVNLDGFSQLLAAISLPPKGSHPVFPNAWPELTSGFGEGAHAGALRRILRWRRSLKRVLGLAEAALPLRSAAAGCALLLAARICLLRLRRLEATLRAGAEDARERDQTATPAWPDDDDSNCAEAVEVWQRGSLLLKGLAQASGADYLHVLQPSPYAPGGSKPLNEEERAAMADERRRIVTAVRDYYPRMAGRAPDLARAGIAFVDGRAFFAGNEETLYKDSLGHFTRKGSQELAAAVAEAIIANCPRVRSILDDRTAAQQAAS